MPAQKKVETVLWSVLDIIISKQLPIGLYHDANYRF
jgi:hypothetical protein